MLSGTAGMIVSFLKHQNTLSLGSWDCTLQFSTAGRIRINWNLAFPSVEGQTGRLGISLPS